MAKGYWNVAGTITNPEGMGPYIAAAGTYLAKCGARFLVRELNTDVREGNRPSDRDHRIREPGCCEDCL